MSVLLAAHLSRPAASHSPPGALQQPCISQEAPAEQRCLVMKFSQNDHAKLSWPQCSHDQLGLTADTGK